MCTYSVLCRTAYWDRWRQVKVHPCPVGVFSPSTGVW